jgi:hypothetical protein
MSRDEIMDDGQPRSGRKGLQRKRRWGAFAGPAVAIVAALAVVFLSGCGKPADQQAREDAEKRLAESGNKLEQAAKELDAAMKQGGAGMTSAMAKMGAAVTGAVGDAAQTVATPVEPVDFRELKTMLPESIGSMKRTAAEGEKGGAMGVVVSHAQGRYEGDGSSIQVKITDPGNLSSFAAMAAVWMNLEMDRETDNGYEKTGSAGGRRFHEKYDKTSKSGEYTMIVGKRYMVEIRGDGVDMATLKKAMDSLDLAKLESMKDAGAKKS